MPPPPQDQAPEEEEEELSDSDTESDEEDEDYDPEATEYEEESEIEEGDLEPEILDFAELGRNYRLGTSAPPILFVYPPGGGKRTKEHSQETDMEPDATLRTSFKNKKYTKEEREYLQKLQEEERTRLLQMEEEIGNSIRKDLIPLRFKVLSSPMEDGAKRLLLQKLDHFSHMSTENGEYFKLKQWLENVTHLPFQKFHPIPVTKEHPPSEIIAFMNNTRKILDDTVYGHLAAKEQILRILAQWISNPTSHGHCIGIHGPMGIGKTSLLKEGLSKALGIPFGFVALGGAADGSFLEGHSYTYEGSTYGKISEILLRTQCSNPILFFDELDKVSTTKKGEEIIGILTHLTDMSQNERFHDKYFGEIELNLSRSLIVFSYNDETLIHPILKDRMITIEVKGYKKHEKVIIAREYMLPLIYKNFGLEQDAILFPPILLEKIMELVPEEEGVRNLKRGLECIVSWINMYRYIPEKEISFPYTVTEAFVMQHLAKKEESMLHTRMYL